MSKTYYIKTYGCQMNVYDSDRMATLLDDQGYSPVDNPTQADMLLLNTCHIREKAAEKVYSDLGRLRRVKNERAADKKDTIITVAGCVAQAEGAEIIRRAPVVDMVLGPQSYHQLPKMLEEARAARRAGRKPQIVNTEFPSDSKFASLPDAARSIPPAAFLTIQEGCDKFCSFCVVPYTRGAEFSRPVTDILRETGSLVARGARDITLLGQNVNAYHGCDAKGREIGLGDLIRELAEIDNLLRIRYTTSHPRDVDDSLIAAHGEVDKLMPYLHLPLQSGSNRILAAMNRGHSRDDYLRIIDKLRAARSDLALSSDIIVGFPGESDNDFADTMDMMRRVNYAQCYSFKYSERPGTPACELEQLPEGVKTERLAELQALIVSQQQAFNQSCVGREFDILVERDGRYKGQKIGRSPYMQAVHFDMLVDGQGAGAYPTEIGGMLRCRIRSAGPNSLAGEVIK